MSEVQRYYVGKYGLVEGESLGRLGVVLGADHDRVTAERDALQALLTAADERVDRLERETREDTTIDERDRYHEMADRLALAISNHFRVEIGEHSSMNCPWTEALNAMNGEYVTDSDHERRVGVLEGLLSRWLSRHAMGAGTDSMVIAETIAAVGVPALKPADDEMTDADWQLKDDMDRYDDEKDQP